MKELEHPTHKRLTGRVTFGVIALFILSLLAGSVVPPAGVRFLIGWCSLLLLLAIAWHFFRWIWCKCPTCGVWLRMRHWHLPTVRRFTCARCGITWNTKMEGPSD
jgi:hypothetical protein